jgi:hypothetical protein
MSPYTIHGDPSPALVAAYPLLDPETWETGEDAADAEDLLDALYSARMEQAVIDHHEARLDWPPTGTEPSDWR